MNPRHRERRTGCRPGRIPDAEVEAILSTADVGLSPDPKNPLNDVSTMNKTMEYMAFGLPVVAFDLKETRVSAQAAASYVPSGDVAAYARTIVELLDDDDRREVMGREGRLRIEEELAWTYQRDAYVEIYDNLVGRAHATTTPEARVIRLPADQPVGDGSRHRVGG